MTFKSFDAKVANTFNDRLFWAFVAGWFAGCITGTIYGGFHWRDLHVEFGRSILLAVTVSQVVTLLIASRVVRNLEKK